jgi:hypothetical protein
MSVIASKVSLKRQIVTALSFLLLLNAFTIGYIVWSLDEGQREHQLTAEIGQLSLSIQMLQQYFYTPRELDGGLDEDNKIHHEKLVAEERDKHIIAIELLVSKLKGKVASDLHVGEMIELDLIEKRIILPALDEWQQFRQLLNQQTSENTQQASAEFESQYQSLLKQATQS